LEIFFRLSRRNRKEKGIPWERERGCKRSRDEGKKKKKSIHEEMAFWKTQRKEGGTALGSK